MVEIREILAPRGSNARSGRKLNYFRGVTIHETDNWGRGAGALSHARYLQGGGSSGFASWHYAVDDKLITRSIPEDEAAWHAGDAGRSTGGNMTTVSIEICVNPDSNYETAKQNAIELAVDILIRHDVEDAQGYLYQHTDWSGKKCPRRIIDEGAWPDFVHDCEREYERRNGYFSAGKYVRVRYGAESLNGESLTSEEHLKAYIITSVSNNYETAVINVNGKLMTFETANLFYVFSDLSMQVGTMVQVRRNAPTYTGGKVSSFVYDGVYRIDNLDMSIGRAVLDQNGINTPFNVVELVIVDKPTGSISVGSMVRVTRGVKTYTGGNVSSFVYDNVYPVDELKGDRAVLDKDGICTPFNVKDLILASSTPTPATIKVGSRVKVRQGAKTYTGGNVASFVYNNVYPVDELKGDRAVLDEDGICTPFNVKDLILQ